jgi:hypothetical protein
MPIQIKVTGFSGLNFEVVVRHTIKSEIQAKLKIKVHDSAQAQKQKERAGREGGHLGKHDEGKAQNVAEGQKHEGHASIDLALAILVADEDSGGDQRGGPEHHGNIHNLHDGNFDEVLHFLGSHLR